MAEPAASAFTIGRLARATGVSIDSLRFYERVGLLPRPSRTAGGFRLYQPEDAQRVHFIRRAKGLGFSLEEIGELLKLAQTGGDRATVKAVARRRLADLDHRIGELQAIRAVLADHERRCSGRGALEGCPIVDALVSGDPPTAQEEGATTS
jgi:DNA-binding transcriptional MerR regulator